MGTQPQDDQEVANQVPSELSLLSNVARHDDPDPNQTQSHSSAHWVPQVPPRGAAPHTPPGPQSRFPPSEAQWAEMFAGHNDLYWRRANGMSSIRFVWITGPDQHTVVLHVNHATHRRTVSFDSCPFHGNWVWGTNSHGRGCLVLWFHWNANPNQLRQHVMETIRDTHVFQSDRDNSVMVPMLVAGWPYRGQRAAGIYRVDF